MGGLQEEQVQGWGEVKGEDNEVIWDRLSFRYIKGERFKYVSFMKVKIFVLFIDVVQC